MKKNKISKTNAIRFLDKNKISYEILSYDCDEFIDAVQIANLCGVSVEKTFKTLVLVSKSGDYYIFLLPANNKIDLKKASYIALEKSLSLIPTKDCLKVVGYERGSISPIGTKKKYKTFIHKSAKEYDKFYISAGKKGLSLCIAPNDLIKLLGAVYADF